MLREGPKTFQERQDEMLSRDVGMQALPLWADPFSFNETTVDLTLGEYFWSFNSCFLTQIGKQEALRAAK